jgi:hypothetical protein
VPVTSRTVTTPRPTESLDMVAEDTHWPRPAFTGRDQRGDYSKRVPVAVEHPVR